MTWSRDLVDRANPRPGLDGTSALAQVGSLGVFIIPPLGQQPATPFLRRASYHFILHSIKLTLSSICTDRQSLADISRSTYH